MYQGEEKGPLLICFGGLHGNEPAGVEALRIIFSLLKIEPETNPKFTFKGKMIGILGNIPAFEKQQRFIQKDLNRQWIPENIDRIRNTPFDQLDSEDQQLIEILELVETETRDYQPEKIVVLDLHTTTASGGIFSISSDDPESISIGVELHAPVIIGFLEGIQGTTLHYFNSDNFGHKTIPVTFESGQHEDPLSINRTIAAVINCMRTIGCVRGEHVENRHDSLLIEYSKNLPKVAELITCHQIKPEDNFRMKPNFKNFQKVKKGDVLAEDKNGTITATDNGLILMPLYQQQGQDGFFLIRSLNGY